MRYGILGTTQAYSDDGTPLPLGGARLRALLAALALRQGRAVPADVLVEEVWDGDPPQDGSGALQTLVGRLRRVLGREAVGFGPEGYWLSAAEEDIDLGRFRRLVAGGERALTAGDPERAAGLLREALALWRGPALADLPDRAAAAARCEAQRLTALRHRIAADLALGRAAEVVPELEELRRRHPLDEPLHALLIRALRADGRLAEALRTYEELRRSLADQLGADPGAELQVLHRELLQPTTPTAPEASEAPAPARPVPAPPAAPCPAAPRPAPGGRGNLRPRLTSFVGREAELAALRRTLGTARLVTLTGPGGSGKTRLSLEAAEAQAATGDWPGGVWVAELAPLDDPAAVPGAVLSALGVREMVLHHGKVAEALEGRTADPVRRLVEHCGGRRMMLLLDNCEHLVQACAELADLLLAECPGLTVLATSREPLGVPGEVVRPVDPLPDPAALRLLAERGAAARPGFDPAQDPQACAEICHRLDGLPLAIELAAARLRGMTARQIADRLDSRLQLLTAGSRTLMPRQQTLRAVVDWSWDLLAKDERALLRRLSVFAGGCTLEAAEQVCADGVEVPREEVAGLLLSLVDKSLVIADLDAGGPARYRMLETIHEYAEERLADAGEGERADTRGRHIRYYRELVRTAAPLLRGPEQLSCLDLLETEHDNIRAALRRAVDAGEEQEALCLVLGMSWFWALRDYHSDTRAWHEAVATLGPDPFEADPGSPEALETGPLDAPPPMPPEVLWEARRQVVLGRMVGGLEQGFPARTTRELAERAERILAAYPPGLPQSARYPALARLFAAFLTGDPDRLPPLLDDMVAGARRFGSDWDLAYALQFRAKLGNDRVGNLEQPVRDAEEALELFRRLGDRWGVAEALSAQAEAASKRGDYPLAAQGYAEAIELAKELGAAQEVPILRIRQGEALMIEDPERAERLVEEGVQQALGLGGPGGGAVFFGRLTLLGMSVQRGDTGRARELLALLKEGSTAMGPVGPEMFRGLLYAMEGWVEVKTGRAEYGLRLVQEGLVLIRELSGPAAWFGSFMAAMLLAPVGWALARLALEQPSPGTAVPDPAARRAALLMGASRALTGHAGNPFERLEMAETERLLRGLLGDAGFDAAYAEGGGLDIEEAAALALAPPP